jgi:hypothetical protein
MFEFVVGAVSVGIGLILFLTVWVIERVQYIQMTSWK